jgi:hypothetical protein
VAEIAALQAALAAEQAVVYGYGVVGAHLSAAAEQYAAARLVAHQTLRDRISALITQLRATPLASLPAYQLPFAVDDAASAKQLAAHLENGSAGALWDLAAATASQSAARSLAVIALTDAALAAARWGSVTALPGQPATG